MFCTECVDICVMKTTKSPIHLARTALAAGKKALPDYSHPKSPHKFTQPQLFAMLVLREFFKLDYRGLVTFVSEWAELRDALELKRVPHYSTLKYAADRLLKKNEVTRFLTQSSASHTTRDS